MQGGALNVFGSTWEDIGPGPRWGHAVAYDSERSRVVLFGGLPVFDADLTNVRDKVLGDTWEHPVISVPSAPLVTLTSVTVSPASLRMGQTANGTITLSGPAALGGVAVTVSSDLGDNDVWFGTTSVAISPGPKQVTIPANASGGTFVCRLHAAPFGTNSFTIEATFGGITRSVTVAVPLI